MFGGDPFFGSVSLLMQAAAGGVADESNNHWTMTANNGAATSATQAQFGGLSYSLLNGGSNNGYFTSSSGAAWSLSGDFTIEAWAFMSSNVQQNFASSNSSVGAAGWSFDTDSSGHVGLTEVGVGGTYSAATVPTNSWAFLAVTRTSNTVRLFINGTLDANTGTTATSWTGVITGAVGWSPHRPNAGIYIDQVRITNGVSRYTTTFTPPAAAFPLGGWPGNTPVKTYLRR